jgi:ATP-dependent Clp protease ATP-binding subunit ClpB
MNRLTQKSQEALHDAQTKALRFGHSEIDGEHLLLALLEQPEGLVSPLLIQAGANPDELRAGVEAELARRPRVSGRLSRTGVPHTARRPSPRAAEREAKRLRTSTSPVERT